MNAYELTRKHSGIEPIGQPRNYGNSEHMTQEHVKSTFYHNQLVEPKIPALRTPVGPPEWDDPTDRAIANSPPPCPDVGDSTDSMMDPGMGPMRGYEIMEQMVEEDIPPYVRMDPKTDIDKLLSARGQTHGDFTNHARITQRLKGVMQDEGLFDLSDIMTEALDMIAHKIGRILAGKPDLADHWDDIAGYAKLVADRVR
jgi:hypothetical protein